MKHKRFYSSLSFMMAIVFLAGFITPASATGIEASTERVDWVTEIESSSKLMDAIDEVATTDGIVNSDNIIECGDNFVVFENDIIINSPSLYSTNIEQRQKEILYVGISRSIREGELSGSETDLTGMFTLSCTVYYTLETDENDIEYISIDRVEGESINLGSGITILEKTLRIGQTGFGMGGYYTQHEDYDPGYVFSIYPPSSWHPITTSSSPCVVGAYYFATIEYSDGSTELVELTNTVLQSGI